MDVITTAFDYEPIEQIGVGQGRNSRVFRANDVQLGGQIAVKEILKADFPDPDQYFEEARAMFRADCPNVVPIRVASAARDHVCLVMPFLANGSLQDRIQSCPLSLFEVIRVGQGMLKGLSQIHVADLIHFDVKPSNILFNDFDVPLVSDFGQSRPSSATGVTAVPLMYRPARPPEVIKYRHGDRQSDIYQAGVTLYRALIGEPSYDAQLSAVGNLEKAICAGKFPRRDAYLPHAPIWLRSVINKAMRVDPTERFQSASEFMQALGRTKVALDWSAHVDTSGEVTWTAAREGTSDIVIRLVRSRSTWDVERYTRRDGGNLRAWDKGNSWAKSGTRTDALKFVAQVFRRLEQA